MSRANQVLSVALIVQIVLAVVLFMPEDSEANVSAGPLLADFEADNAVSLTITDGNDNTITLRKADDDEWVLPEYGDYPAKSFNVRQVLNGLEGVERNRLIVRNSSSHKRLSVSSDEFERQIEVEMADGSKRKVYLGKSSGASAAHIRLDGEDNVYLTAELVAWEVPATLTSWINTTYFSVTTDDIVALQIENANGVFQLEKTDDTWRFVGLAEGEEFDPESVSTLLGRLRTIRMTQPIGREADPAWKMDEPAAKVTLTVLEPVIETDTEGEEDAESEVPSVSDLLPPTATPEADETEEPAEPVKVEKTYTLTFGQQLEGSAYPLISSESEFYVKVAASTAKAFIDLTRESFMVQEEEEADETEAEADDAEADADSDAADAEADDAKAEADAGDAEADADATSGDAEATAEPESESTD